MTGVVGPAATESLSVWTRLARNASSSVLATLVSLMTGFLVMPYIVKHLGATAFGIWMLVNSLVGYMGLLDVGLAPTLVRKSAGLLSGNTKDSAHELNRVVSTIFWVYVCLACGVVILLVVASLGVSRFFQIPEYNQLQFQRVLWLAGLQAALAFPMSVWHGLNGGLQDYHVSNFLGILTNLVRAISSVLLLYFGFGLLSLVFMGFVISIGVWIFLYTRVHRRIPHLNIQRSLVTKDSVRRLVPMSGIMIIWSIAGYSLHQLDRVIIALLLPVASLTTYEVGNRLSENSRSIIQSWLNTVLPSAAAMRAQKQEEQLTRLYLHATKYLFASYLAVAICLAVFGSSFIRLWMGPQYSTSAKILMILVAGNMIQSVNIAAHVMLVGIGELRVFARIMTAYPLTVVALSIFLVPRYGLIGMAAALTVTIALMEVTFFPFIVRTFHVSGAYALRKAILPALLPILLGSSFALWFVETVPADSWPLLVAGILLTLVLFGSAMFLVGLDDSEKRGVRGLIDSLAARFGAQAPNTN